MIGRFEAVCGHAERMQQTVGPSRKVTRVCLVGAGFIARTHAEVLQALPGLCPAVVVDPNAEAARRLARTFGIEGVFPSVEAALREGGFGAAHVLVPPPLHRDVTVPLIDAGIPTLVEKPLAASAEQARALAARAEEKRVVLGVNQNFVHHPAFVRLREALAAGSIGKARFLFCAYHLPLRQLSSDQFGHWMFDAPANLLLEQAVHPLSQIVALAGPVERAAPLVGPPLDTHRARPLYPLLDVSLACARMPAQLHFAVGESYPIWQLTVIGDDGMLTADVLSDRFYADRRTRWVGSVDRTLSGWRTAVAIIRDSNRNLAADLLSRLRLRPRSDAFFESMRGGIASFHEALAGGRSLEADGEFGAEVVAACEAIAEAAYGKLAPATCTRADSEERRADVALLGGTGFIGRHLLARLLAEGRCVSVMARSVRNLPALFEDPRVTLHRGDICDKSAVVAAVGEAPVVVNLAHGGGGGSWEEISHAMVGGAQTVARVCLEKGVRRLVHVSSIAALYLGPGAATVTSATPADPAAHRRADYARAKALSERMLLDLHAHENLPVVILRPGLVVGAGASPFHSGVGFYNNEQHCLGWNDGRNPLPFVLVEDVAAAIAEACRAPKIEGRTLNLVGDVRLNARDYIAALALALGRPLRYHPQSPFWVWLVERVKWLVKRLNGRAATLSLHDLHSRGLRARFDCSDTRKALSWQPVADRATFLARAFASLPVER